MRQDLRQTPADRVRALLVVHEGRLSPEEWERLARGMPEAKEGLKALIRQDEAFVRRESGTGKPVLIALRH